MENQTVTKFRIHRQVHSDHIRMYFSKFPLTEIAESAIKGATFDYQSPVLEVLMEVPGIEAATVYPYYVAVQKAVAYGWEEIEGAVLCLLTSLNISLPSCES